ncbi:MAG: EpsG family protein [Prevotellaceae bacterium]|jgi:hypothetical protein|nr:EpsG family protein [Prevotellaceae bacterium]
MLFYILFIGIVLGLFYIAQYRINSDKSLTKDIVECFGLFIIIAVSIFRFDVGYDYPTYYELIDSHNPKDVERFEPLSTVFIKIAYFFKTPCLIFILFGLPTYILIFKALKKYSVDFYLSALIYLFLFYLNSLGSIRQALAISIVSYAFGYVKERRTLIFFAFCILASQFHTPAIIGVAIYFLYRFSFLFVLLSLIVISVAYPIVKSLLSNHAYISEYLQNITSYSGGDKIRVFYLILFTALLALTFYRRKPSLAIDKGLFSIILPGVFLPFLFGGHLGGRIAEYFLIYLAILIPQVLSLYQIRWKALCVYILMLYFFLLLYKTQFVSERSPYIPYQSIFFADTETPTFRWTYL